MVKFEKANMPKFIPGGFKPFIFFKEVKNELSKVIWPTREKAIKLTAIVVGISALVAIFIGAWDFIFTKLMALLIRK